MLIPSIDLQNNRIVQLVQGEKLALEAADPEVWIERFTPFPRVQLIDLDAARGRGDNAALATGAHAVIASSALFSDGAVNTAFAAELAAAVGRERVIAAVDSRGGQVVIHGWKTTLPIKTVDAVRALEPYCSEFLYTHVDLEGLMQGTDIDAILAVRQATTCRVTAAGGITTWAEIDRLDAEDVDAVVGMAVYTGQLPLTR
jgi:phosphoribosylformimino-5-aminoimidazole carboxamide ribotide isomerase